MITPIRDQRVRRRDRAAFAAAGACAVMAVLIWTLWVLPVASSVKAAEPVPIGAATTVRLEPGERAGIWGLGRSAILGTAVCAVTAPDGREITPRSGPSLDWADTLWWMTPRWGFEQFSQFTASEAGDHTVQCIDALDVYEGEFLVAGDAFGGGSIGLGRGGGAGFATGSLLAFGAVTSPLIAVLIVIVIPLRRLRDRARERRVAGSAGGALRSPQR